MLKAQILCKVETVSGWIVESAGDPGAVSRMRLTVTNRGAGQEWVEPERIAPFKAWIATKLLLVASFALPKR